MRFDRGKAVGTWFIWDLNGNMILHVEFKEPYDYMKYQRFSRIRYRPASKPPR